MQLKEATVLLVDDEPGYREILSGWFAKEGCRVFAAENGIRALEVLKKDQVHAIVADVRMPEMDGTELVKRVKAGGKYTPTTVSISGFSDLTPREACDLGIEAQLAKPVERMVLISAVRRSLMEREELWAEPFRTTTAPIIKMKFESVGTSVRKKQLLFGRGGFCVRSKILFREMSLAGFEMDFAADGVLVSLQGVVRWSVPDENLTGIEILRVSDQGRTWLASLMRANETMSFIPRSTHIVPITGN
jgi:CheY-like chemotaxis protein